MKWIPPINPYGFPIGDGNIDIRDSIRISISINPYGFPIGDGNAIPLFVIIVFFSN